MYFWHENPFLHRSIRDLSILLSPALLQPEWSARRLRSLRLSFLPIPGMPLSPPQQISRSSLWTSCLVPKQETVVLSYHHLWTSHTKMNSIISGRQWLFLPLKWRADIKKLISIAQIAVNLIGFGNCHRVHPAMVVVNSSSSSQQQEDQRKVHYIYQEQICLQLLLALLPLPLWLLQSSS